MTATYTADIDIGGTFTDGFFTDGVEQRSAKTLTTPHDLTDCFTACLRLGAAAFGLSLAEFLRATAIVRLSTTLGTNTLLEHRGPRLGLIVSEGHEADLYSADGTAAVVLGGLVDPEFVVTVGDPHGNVGADDGESVLAGIRRLVNAGAQIVAVALAGGIRASDGERAVRSIVADRYPDHYLRSVPLQLSHEISPGQDDHVRANTVIVNAYIHGDLARGLYRAEDEVRSQGLGRPLLVADAAGGCARVAKTVAVRTLNSGPAAAVAGAAAMRARLGLDRVVTADMGGTSLDIAVLDERGTRASDGSVHGIALAVPMIRTESVAIGGGSIATVDHGRVRVGPASAGSTPGPACFGRGGTRATVTDADLVLGFLAPNGGRGGGIPLDRAEAEAALLSSVGEPLGVDVMQAARLVREEANRLMASAVTHQLAVAGGEPSEHALFAIGGGGPVHGCGIAEQAGIPLVVAFPFGSVFSAFGSSTTDIRHGYVRLIDTSAGATQAADEIGRAIGQLAERALADMRGEGFADREVRLVARLQFLRNGSERIVDVPLDLSGLPRTGLRETFATAPDDCIVRVEVDATGVVAHWSPSSVEAVPWAPRPTGTRIVRWTADAVETPTYVLTDLSPGASLAGPAIIDSPDTAIAVGPGWGARVDEYGNAVLERAS